MVIETADLDGVFGALSNEHRREMVNALSLHPRSISQLASLRDLSLPAIHKHVKVMEEAGLVVRKKVGRTNFLALNRSPLRNLQDWAGRFHAYWGDERETLENYARFLGEDLPEEGK